jgi:hypothetical protein
MLMARIASVDIYEPRREFPRMQTVQVYWQEDLTLSASMSFDDEIKQMAMAGRRRTGKECLDLEVMEELQAQTRSVLQPLVFLPSTAADTGPTRSQQQVLLRRY